MDKNKIFGYVDNDLFEFLEDTKRHLYDKKHFKVSKSMIIQLALIELMNDNDLASIERKLLNKRML